MDSDQYLEVSLFRWKLDFVLVVWKHKPSVQSEQEKALTLLQGLRS